VLWTGPNSFYSNSRLIQIPNADTSLAGVYSVTIWDNIRDTIIYRQKTVCIISPADELLTAEYDHACLGTKLNLTIPQYDPLWNYTLSTNPPITVPTVINANPVLSIPTNLSPGALVINLIGSYQSSQINVSITVTVESCCLDFPTAVDVHLLYNKTTSDLTIADFTPTTAIKGTLTVDNNFILPTGCTELIMLENSQIIVMPEKDLQIYNTYIHGCENLWNSIILNDESHLNLTHDSITDATSVVYSVLSSNAMQSHIIVRTSKIVNNRNCIILSTCTPDNYLSNNEFWGQPPGLLGMNGMEAEIGIYLENCANTSFYGGLTNQLHDLRWGIWAFLSDLNIGPDVFHFYNFYSPFIEKGPAIYLENLPYSPTMFTFMKSGNSPNTFPDFENCGYAIFNKNYSMHVTGNNFLNVDTAIYVQGRLKDIEISKNTIECNRSGIFLSQLFPLGSLIIDKNNITLTNSATKTNTAAIRSYNYGFAPNTFAEILNNSIFIPQGGFGIDLNSSLDYLVKENTIQLGDEYSNVAGIRLVDCENTHLLCNYISGPGPNKTVTGQKPYGIQIDASTNGRYSFNQTTNTYTGVRFEDNCANTSFDHHDFFDHHIGLYYNNNAVTGDQLLKANRWNGVYTTSAQHVGSAMFSYYSVGLQCTNCMPVPSNTSKLVL
jgi:hypothetical protein